MANPKLNDPWQRLLLLMVLMLAVNFAYLLLFAPHQEPVAELSYSSFKAELARDRVASVQMSGERVTGNFRDVVDLPTKEGTANVAYSRFQTVLPPVADPELLPLLEKNGVEIEAKASEKPTFWASLLISLLPWVLIIGVWVFILKRMRESNGPGGGLFGQFRRSGAKLYSQQLSRVTFNEVAGLAEAKQELGEIISYLRDPRHFTRLGGKVPRGILLVGPPGTGKTLLARAVAGEAEVPFFTISASQFIEMFVGVGASRVRDLFENAKKSAPAIIFIDELDAVGRSRGAGLGGGNDEREQTLNQLLSELDGFEAHQEVIVLAATNRPDVLDPALLRPGRFDRQVVVPTPDVRGRKRILQVHTRKVPLAGEVDLEILARGTPGFSGADLENLVNEAALHAAKLSKDQVFMADFEEAKDKVLMGKERRSVILSDEEKKTTAFHEAGHALVAKMLPGTDPVHKVSIIPRGMALGVTMQLPVDDRHNYSKVFLENQLAMLLGGRVAEEMILDQQTTGASNDIDRATKMARKMVCQWGMSEKIGPLSFGDGGEQIFLGRELIQHKNYSEDTARIIDDEIRRVIDEAHEKARSILNENREALNRIAEALLERETISGDDIDLLIKGDPLPPMNAERSGGGSAPSGPGPGYTPQSEGPGGLSAAEADEFSLEEDEGPDQDKKVQ